MCLALLLALGACGSGGGSDTALDTRPNILMIVIDDVGYSDIGAFGSEIRTPHIDELARDGRLLGSFYSGAVCAPSRAMLISGADHHRVGVGINPEVVAALIVQDFAPFGTQYGFDNLPDEYRGYLSDGALSMPELFRDSGYRTMMSGKWHLAQEVTRPRPGQLNPLQPRPASFPDARGFEQSFMLLDFGGSHFAPTPGKPNRYDLVTYGENGKLLRANDLPQDYYSSVFFTDKLLGYLKADENTEKRKPFFAYLSYTAGHFPLQAPQEDIAAYAGHYDDGYQVIRERRIQRLKALGLIAPDFAVYESPDPPDPNLGEKRWDQLAADEKAYQARVMEIYAAMLTNMDRQIGRVVRHLKDTGQYENTVILLLSDNGPDDGREAPEGPNLDNSYQNLGKPGSAAVYGARWAEVGSTPFRMWKGRAGAEGSNSTPAIIKLPDASNAGVPLTIPVHITDVLPTLLHAAGIPVPEGVYQGRDIIDIEGVSQWAALQEPSPQPALRPHGMIGEALGIAAYVRDGPWKLSRQPVGANTVEQGFEDIPWNLFNMDTDRGETVDLAASHPDVVQRLEAMWRDYVERNKVLLHTGQP
ncbi:arylsulfatase [Pusillimonas sp.]|uniref:arylsulfatase n=1 Tax=Pusillimonas sp. TaxID=3040095 RepID=UPI0037C77B8F